MATFKIVPPWRELDALSLATMFHDIYERLAPSHGYETRPETRQFDPESPNGKLMIATCKAILEELVITREKLRKESGTPEEFEKAVWRAHADLFCTTDEAVAAIAKYKNEWASVPSTPWSPPLTDQTREEKT